MLVDWLAVVTWPELELELALGLVAVAGAVWVLAVAAGAGAAVFTAGAGAVVGAGVLLEVEVPVCVTGLAGLTAGDLVVGVVGAGTALLTEPLVAPETGSQTGLEPVALVTLQLVPVELLVVAAWLATKNATPPIAKIATTATSTKS